MIADGINYTASSATSSAGKTKDASGTTKDQFLQILLTQLKNQDPLQPPDPTQFTQQLTQYGQLEQLFKLNDSFASLAQSQKSIERSQALSMVNHTVSAKSDEIEIQNGQVPYVGISVASPAETVQLEIVDSLGRVVRKAEFSHVNPGTTYYGFDGKDDLGQNLSEGIYRVRLKAFSPDHTPISIEPVTQGIVSGVDFSSGSPMIEMGHRLISMDEILSVDA